MHFAQKTFYRRRAGVHGRAVNPLAEAGVIDTAFPGIAARAGLDWRIFGAASDAALAALLAEAPNDAAKS